jgi:protein-tyrosine phosphatase
VRITTNRNGYSRPALIDLHSHILPGIDDGPETLERSLAMARSAVEDGIRVLAATPHVRHDWPTTPERMEATLAALREAVDREGIELKLLPGGELDLERAAMLEVDELRRFGLGGSPTWLLLEFPYAGWPLGLSRLANRLGDAGFGIVLAHPERNRDVQARPDRLQEFADLGMLVQLTAASVDGRLGRSARETSLALLDLGLAHLLASDAHEPSVRAIGLSSAAESLGDPELARWLTDDVPGAVVASAPIPQRPSAARVARR